VRSALRNPRRTFAVFLTVLLAVTLTACTGAEPSTGSITSSGTSTGPSGTTTTSPFDPTTPAKITGPVLAYRAADEIGVVDGTTKLTSTSGAFAPSNDLLTTEDGRYVFARTVDNQLATIDVRKRRGDTRQLTVGPALGTNGASTIVWWEQPNRLMQLDLADPASTPVVLQTVDLPPAPQAGQPRLIAARAGTTILARVESPPTPFGGPDTLYAVRGPGAPTSLGQVDADSPVTSARLSPDGGALAYALYRATSDTCGTAAVVQSDANGTQQTFEVASADPAAAFQVGKLWWPKVGPPKLSLRTWMCNQPQAVPPVVWQLSGDHIAQVAPPTSALQTAELEPGQRALILPHTDGYRDPSGSLVVEESSRRIPVQDDVDAMAVIEPAP
jgi:hypothetical protein